MADTNRSQEQQRGVSVANRQGSRQGALSRERYSPGYGLGGDLFSMSPFALMRRLSDEMDRIFSDTPSHGEFGGAQGYQHAVWMPTLEVRERDNNLVVTAELPGIEKNDVNVEVTDDALIIEGERKQEHKEERGGFHRSERSYGRFYRAIALPEGVKADNAKAHFNNGVLEVTIPIDQAKQNRRRIEVQSGGQSSAQSSGSSRS